MENEEVEEKRRFVDQSYRTFFYLHLSACAIGKAISGTEQK